MKCWNADCHFQRIYSKLLDEYSNQKEKALADCLFKFYAIELDKQLVVDARMKVFKFFMTEIEQDVDLLMLCQIIYMALKEAGMLTTPQ